MTAFACFGKPDKVAATIAFFARADAAFITGGTHNVDSGILVQLAA